MSEFAATAADSEARPLRELCLRNLAGTGSTGWSAAPTATGRRLRTSTQRDKQWPTLDYTCTTVAHS